MVNDVVHVVGILSLSPGVDDQDAEDGGSMQGVTGPSAARLVSLKGKAPGAHSLCSAWLMHLVNQLVKEQQSWARCHEQSGVSTAQMRLAAHEPAAKQPSLFDGAALQLCCVPGHRLQHRT